MGMPESSAHTQEEQLNLSSRLAELNRVALWVESLAVEHDLPPELVFAVNLCMEEALSNVIRHGYGGEPDHAIAIRCSIRSIRSIRSRRLPRRRPKLRRVRGSLRRAGRLGSDRGSSSMATTVAAR